MHRVAGGVYVVDGRQDQVAGRIGAAAVQPMPAGAPAPGADPSVRADLGGDAERRRLGRHPRIRQEEQRAKGAPRAPRETAMTYISADCPKEP